MLRETNCEIAELAMSLVQDRRARFIPVVMDSDDV